MKPNAKPSILVLWAGRHRRGEWASLCDSYISRIKRHLELAETVVKAPVSGGSPVRRAAEGRSILEKVPRGSYLVALDSRGRQRTSEELAAWLEKRLEDSRRPLVFSLGSDLGLAPEVTAAADEKLSFGAPTLPHELARLVLFEQLYRALSILKGMKYHRQPLEG